MGLKQPLTVWRWLHESRKKGQSSKPLLSAYVHELDGGHPSHGFDNAPRTFEVTQDEIPLGILSQVAEQAQQSQDWAEVLKAVFAQMSPMKSRRCPHMIAQMSPTGSRRCPHIFAQMSPYLSSLNSLKTNSLNSNKQNLPTRKPDKETPKSKTSPVGGVGDIFVLVWDWECIFDYNPEIAPQDQDLLRGRDPGRFAAWLIYAYSKKGQGIDDPVIFAVRRVQQGKAEPAEFGRFRTGSLDYLYDQLAHNMDDALLPQNDETRTILRKRLFGPKS